MINIVVFLVKKLQQIFTVTFSVSLLALVILVTILAPHMPANALILSAPEHKISDTIFTSTDHILEEQEVLVTVLDEADDINKESLTQAISIDIERQFYTKLSKNNRRIVEAVYTYARELNKDLLFALMIQESSCNPLAINENIRDGVVVSVDRGLFQLNSTSYPDLEESQAYHIETNIRYGIAHYRYALEQAHGNPRKALWIYNAGYRGIKNGVPERTIAYANAILANVKDIEAKRIQYINNNLGNYVAMATGSDINRSSN